MADVLRLSVGASELLLGLRTSPSTPPPPAAPPVTTMALAVPERPSSPSPAPDARRAPTTTAPIVIPPPPPLSVPRPDVLRLAPAESWVLGYLGACPRAHPGPRMHRG
jgi:hypothetical protein